MNITDKKAKAILDRIAMEELFESIEDYPEDERDGRSDMEFITDEISYFVSNFNESGHVYEEDLQEARRILRETKQGKVIPLIVVNNVPVRPRYTAFDIQRSKDTVAQYNRLRRALTSLNKKGFYGRWA